MKPRRRTASTTTINTTLTATGPNASSLVVPTTLPRFSAPTWSAAKSVTTRFPNPRATALLGFLPLPRLRRPKHRLDHRHIRHRVLDRTRHLTLAAHRARKRIPLNRVLITHRKRLGRHPAAKH